MFQPTAIIIQTELILINMIRDGLRVSEKGARECNAEFYFCLFLLFFTREKDRNKLKPSKIENFTVKIKLAKQNCIF